MLGRYKSGRAAARELQRGAARHGFHGDAMQFEITKGKDDLPKLLKQVHDLHSKIVLVGVPDERGSRDESTGKEITNAALAFIHQNGSPAANIPARPFMTEGAASVQDRITQGLLRIGEAQLDPKTTEQKMYYLYARLGEIAANGIKRKMTQGPWHKLAAGTKAYRLRVGKRTDMKPLIFTGQLRASVTYVVRRVGSVTNLMIGPKEVAASAGNNAKSRAAQSSSYR